MKRAAAAIHMNTCMYQTVQGLGLRVMGLELTGLGFRF